MCRSCFILPSASTTPEIPKLPLLRLTSTLSDICWCCKIQACCTLSSCSCTYLGQALTELNQIVCTHEGPRMRTIWYGPFNSSTSLALPYQFGRKTERADSGACSITGPSQICIFKCVPVTHIKSFCSTIIRDYATSLPGSVGSCNRSRNGPKRRGLNWSSRARRDPGGIGCDFACS